MKITQFENTFNDILDLKMTFLVLLFVVFSLSASDDIYVWTEWSNEAKCARRCSKSYGTRLYRRQCMMYNDEFCKPVVQLYCGGPAEKTELCYVGSQCFGEGIYRGQWTEWSRSGVCPPVDERCNGEKLVSFRRCILPAAYQRRSMTFRCPGDQSVKKVEPCPCEVSSWSEWSEWTLCSPSGTDTRDRERVCIKNKHFQCTGASVEESPCLKAATVSRRGRPRKRKDRNGPMQGGRHDKLSPYMMDVIIASVLVSFLLFVLGVIAIIIYCRRKVAKKKREAKQEKTLLMSLPPRAVPSAPPLYPTPNPPRLVPSAPPQSVSPQQARCIPSALTQYPATHPP